MTKQELYKLLKEETNMTDYDIRRHIKDGISVFPNDEQGKHEFVDEFVECTGEEPEEAIRVWESLEVIGNYRLDFTL